MLQAKHSKKSSVRFTVAGKLKEWSLIMKMLLKFCFVLRNEQVD